jgi:putative membrane protein
MARVRLPYSVVLSVLGGVLAAQVLWLGWRPVSRETWLLENLLVFILVAVLALSYRRFPLSRLSYAMIFVFLTLHEVGAHYTYSLVPYDAAWQRLFGWSLDEALGFERNHFDRVIHFSYGLLFFYPVREIFVRIVDVRGVWGYLLPLDVAMSTSMIYELLEWAVAAVFGGDVGPAYLGTQGDVWDAHKDMALASLGAMIAMTLTAAVSAGLKRDFARELAESLAVKHPRPLGEEEIAVLLDERHRDE